MARSTYIYVVLPCCDDPPQHVGVVVVSDVDLKRARDDAENVLAATGAR